MSLAAAVSAPSGPVAYLTYRPGSSSGDAPEPSVAPPEPAEKSAPRYVSLSFTYNQDAARLVMLYRSPSTGETVSQIPSEVALKRYEAAARPEIQPEHKSKEFGDRNEEKKAGLPQQTTGTDKGTGKGTGVGTGVVGATGTGSGKGSASTGASTDAGSTGTASTGSGSGSSAGTGSGRVDVVV